MADPLDTTVQYEEDRRQQRLQEAALFLDQLSAGVRETPVQPQSSRSALRTEGPAAGPLGIPSQQGRRGQGREMASGALKVAKDVAQGITEAPRQTVGGITEILPDTLDALADLGSYFQANFARTPEGEEAAPGGEPLLTENLQKTLDAIQIREAKSVTGSLIRQTANFLSAFVPFLGQAGKVTTATRLGQKVPTAARITRDMLAGGAADFVTTDTVPEGVSGLLEDETVGPSLLAFIEGDPDDSGLEQRLRQTLIGAGLGTLADGIFLGAKALRGRHIARREAEVAGREIGAGIETLGRSEGELRISELPPDAPLVSKAEVSEERLAQAMAEVEARFGDEPISPERIRALAEAEVTTVEVNVDRLGTIDDVKRLVQDTTDIFRESVDEARRGVQSNAASQEAADILGVSLEDVLSRPIGGAFNNVELLSLRKLHASMAETVYDMAEAVAKAPGDEAAQFKLRRAFAAFHAINKEFLGTRAEAGRALQQFNIVATSDQMRARMLSDLLEAQGGREVSDALAKRLVKMRQMGASPGKLSKMVSELTLRQKTVAAVKESFVLGLLWTPSTHVVNMTSNSLVATQQIYERAVARGLTKLAGREGVEAGETLAMIRGTVQGIRAAFRLGEMERGLREQALELTGSRNKIDVRTHAISSEAFGLGDFATREGQTVFEPSTMGRFLDYYGAATRAPGTALQIEDDFFKTIGYTAELHAQAARQAAREGAEKGWARQQTSARYADLVQNPSEAIRLEAADAALYRTFQQRSDGRAMRTAFFLRRNVPGTFVVLPFARTPINIFRYTFERTPLAPLVGQWRDDVFTKGGAARDIALARMATGSAITLALFDMAWEGFVTGGLSQDRGIREVQLRLGLQPDSLVLGEPGKQVTVRLSRLDPIGFQLSVMGSLAEVLKSRDVEDEDLDEVSEVLAMMAVATVEATRNKTWLAGISRIIASFEDPQQFMGSFIRQTAGSFVPMSTLWSTIENFREDEMPDTSTLWESIESRIVGLAGRLPRKRDLWGRPIVVDAINKISPVRIEEVSPEPIDAEMLRLGFGPTRIGRTTHFNGGAMLGFPDQPPPVSVDVNFRQFPKAYEAYVELAGGGTENGVRSPGTGERLLPFLNDLVSGRSPQSAAYESLSPYRKERLIRNWVSRYRELAQVELLQDPDRRFQGPEFQAFRRYIAEKKLRVLDEMNAPDTGGIAAP